MKRLSSRLRTGMAATLLATQLLACTSWHVVDPSPVEFTMPVAQPVRVTLPDSSTYVMHEAVVVDGRVGPAPGAHPGVRLTAVSRLETRRFSLGNTTLLVGLIVGAAAVIHQALSFDLDFGGGLGGWNWGLRSR